MRVRVALLLRQLILRAWPGIDSEGCLPPQLHVQRLLTGQCLSYPPDKSILFGK